MRTFARRPRVIINSDAKNEADDQYALVHALLSPSLDIRGLIAAHFGNRPGRSTRSMLDSREEIDLVLDLLGQKARVENGAPAAIPDVRTPAPSAGAELIVEEALREDAEPLYIAFLGPLTDMASALLLEPRIAQRDVTVIWIGGAGYDEPAELAAKPEFNLSNDIVAAGLVFAYGVTVWQVPRSTYRLMSVSYAELDRKVGGCGRLGGYLIEQLVEWNARNEPGIEYRSLGDSPAIGLMLNPMCGHFRVRPAPGFRYDGSYDLSVEGPPIRVYEQIDNRFILEDMFAKIQLATR
jgi:inosine-uridine nucleoside N-ribohydrolase